MEKFGIELPPEHYLRAVGGKPIDDFRRQSIEYVDIKPRPITVQIPLVEYFERIKRLKADRWQADFCNRLQEAAVHRHEGRVLNEFHAEGQLGKPLDVATPVLMGDGSYKPLGAVRVGDSVITHTGSSRQVTEVFEQGFLDTLEITTNSGRRVVAALDHPFLTPEGWVEAKDLRVGQALGCVPEPRTTGVSPRSCAEFEMLGYFIGDGCVVFSSRSQSSIQCAITSGDDLLTARIMQLADEFGWAYRSHRKPRAKCDTLHFSQGARDWVRMAGIAGQNSWTKRVPEWVFAGSQEQIAAFIGAYFACDGTFGRKENTVIDFGSVSLGLLEDLQRLLLRVGVQSRVVIKNGVYKGSRHQSHRLYFCSQDYTTQFIAKVPIYGRKGVLLKAIKRPRKTFQAQYLTDTIVAIETAGKRECRCLSVEVDRTFTANDLIVHNTTILSQTYPAWLFGHDPLFRYALAMYNKTQSEKHAQVVIQIMQGKAHRDIFPNKEGWLPNVASKSGFMTNARLETENGAADGQLSLNPVGLQSGLTGSGFDQLTIDDPYKEAKEAFSIQINQNLINFWEFTVISRLGLYSNVAAMFHRYSPDDFGGYLLRTGLFDYVRYATVADGPFIDEETGRSFPDPLDRQLGEYISPERRPPSYYTEVRRNNRVWLSMFQGRPSSEEGEFFNVGKIVELGPEATRARREECTVRVRAWDTAATEEGGDYSVGTLIGMDPDKRSAVFDVVRAQVETAGRDELMLKTAQGDGYDVVITIPVDPGAAGKTAAFHIQQLLAGYQVVLTPTSGSKEDRARPVAAAINSGQMAFASDQHLEAERQWNRVAKRELREFPLSDHDDIVDTIADGYNECYRRVSQGLVVKGFTPQRNVIAFHSFSHAFDPPVTKIPEHWTVYAGLRVSPDASLPNSGVLVARPAQNTKHFDDLFVIAEYKDYTADHTKIFEWLDLVLDCYCESKTNTTIWLHPDSENYGPTIRAKTRKPVRMFEGDEHAGITELNWYVVNGEPTHLYAVVQDATQLLVPHDEFGLCALRQEAATWTYTDKGVPAKTAPVLDCLRMITYAFRTVSAPKSFEERVEDAMPDSLKLDAIKTMDDPDQRDLALTRRQLEQTKVRQALSTPVRGAHTRLVRRR